MEVVAAVKACPVIDILWGLVKRDLEGITAVGVDEISVRGGFFKVFFNTLWRMETSPWFSSARRMSSRVMLMAIHPLIPQ